MSCNKVQNIYTKNFSDMDSLLRWINGKNVMYFRTRKKEVLLPSYAKL